ncbi:IclR family transcriptional regulator domain-containing protein [Bosea minatitlanensis]|uniref:Helix-turn-helix domain-containing protein n=1 Tax=Bosea minatitlanensis TaxID=128782 RepID=A0ABW0F555_9HYPH|nr:helix-turn-helix domain-containing protein [Bosea minatitlanensis]MCT4495286.1 helix-turn-helix domain-containing protein [Bosea minatitlanensis]
MASFEPVRAITRGLTILRLVSEHGPITATDLARAAKLPQPTVVRILETLIDAGYAYRRADNVTFGVTARTKLLSSGYDATSRLLQLAEPLIENLRAEIGWPSNLATLEDDAMVIIYTNRNAKGLSIPGRLGARIPLLATGVGIVQLAGLAPEALQAQLARLRQSQEPWDASPELWEGLDDRLAAARRDGYAFAHERYLDAVYQSQIWAVAVPIVVEGRTEAALSSLVLRGAGPRQQLLDNILPALRRTAATIGSQLSAEA